MSFVSILLGLAFFAQSDSKLPIHTLVREDFFAGLLAGDMQTLARGEAKLQELKTTRPEDLAVIQAWESEPIALRATLAYKDGKSAEGDRLFAAAWELQSSALAASPKATGVLAVVGGTWVVIADRLPREKRAAAWQRALECYQALLRAQEPALQKLPVHHRGELLTGIVMAAQRTGDKPTFEKYFAMAEIALEGTPYAPLLSKWKADPGLSDRSNIACKSCHEPGKLANIHAAAR